MLLSEYLNHLQELVVPANSVTADPEISSVENDSRKVVQNTFFCAIKGFSSDGHQYLQKAVDSGAAALIVSAEYDGFIPGCLPVFRTKDSYLVWGCLCEIEAGFPADSFRVHGITGTNGKTSTAFFLNSILNSKPGLKAALLSTVCNACGDGSSVSSSGTMADAKQLQKFFSSMKANSVTDAVMECSSHGLSQARSGRLQYSSAVFSNLTGDHLDYHKTMENYYQAKKRLFSQFLGANAPAVINIDDPYGKRLADELVKERKHIQLCALSLNDPAAFCCVSSVQLSASGTDCTGTLDGQKFHLRIPLIGTHNVQNLFSAASAAYALGMKLDDVFSAMEHVPQVPGRLEAFILKNGARAFVDYAHTDDAIFRVLTALRSVRVPGSRILTVFGCGGDRDRTKRPRMGKVVSELSDIAFVTSDNPRSEEPEDIISEILSGMTGAAERYINPDRRESIADAVAVSRANDLILIAGKGHENYQEIDGIKHHFDDREEVRRFV